MPWLRVNSRFHSHISALTVSDAALGLWLRGACWVADYPKQDDFIPTVVAKHLARRRAGRKGIDQLIASELWIEVEGGYVMNRTMFREAGCGRFDHLWSVQMPAERPHIPASIRTAVYERDGHACVSCGATETLSLDHVHPYSLGGEDSVRNLQTMCRSCNSRKGARV